MPRPLGITFSGLTLLLMGVVWLFGFVAALAFLTEDLARPLPWGLDDLLLFGGSLLCAALFLAAGYGLFRLRNWARRLTILIAVFISVALAADFILSSSSLPHDRIGQWESLVIYSRLVLLLPFYLVSLLIWEGVSYLYPGSKSWLDLAVVITTHMAGFLGYAGIARYMLTARVKQAFGAAS